MSEFGKIPTMDSIIRSHEKMGAETNKKQQMSEMQLQEIMKLIWLKLKGIREEIESVKMIYRSSDIGDHKRIISEIIKGIDYNASRGDHYLKELLDDFHQRGKTGVFDLESIKKMISEQDTEDTKISRPPQPPAPPPAPEPIQDTAQNGNIIPNPSSHAGAVVMDDHQRHGYDGNAAAASQPKPKQTLKLKPIGRPYNDGQRDIVLANNKMDDNLYVVDLSNKKVICQPSDISDIYTDEIGSQKIATAMTRKGETYFIDTFNKKIFSGPFFNIREVFMTHRYQNMVISQILNEDGSRFFINVLTGLRINPSEFY